MRGHERVDRPGPLAVQSLVLGVVTATGGGVVRDLLVGEVPTVMREGLYAVPALLGAAFPVLADLVGSTSPAFTAAGVLVCVVVRMAGLRYGLNLPTDPPLPRRRQGTRPPGPG